MLKRSLSDTEESNIVGMLTLSFFPTEKMVKKGKKDKKGKKSVSSYNSTFEY